MYFAPIYDNRKIKPIGIFPEGERGRGRTMEGVNPT
jgi:hypothetical protein